MNSDTIRLCGTIYSGDSRVQDNFHHIALYCVDWSGTGTVLDKIEIFESSDSSYSNPLDTRNLQLPSNGIYLVWKLKGHKVIKITKPDASTDNKALVSALFIGGGT